MSDRRVSSALVTTHDGQDGGKDGLSPDLSGVASVHSSADRADGVTEKPPIALLGIVTDRDLRSRAVAEGLPGTRRSPTS